MRDMTVNRRMSGKFIKTTPSKLRNLADLMEEDLREFSASVVELDDGIILFVEKETNYVAFAPPIDSLSRPD